MKKAFFITGTDTDIGKTYTTTMLLNYFNEQGLKTAGLKPIASGAEQTSEGLRNDDALQIQAAMSMPLPYEQINPFAFEDYVTPHLAAAPQKLDVETTLQACQPVLDSDYDVLLIEGAGGWTVPLNYQESFADLATAFGFPIILVVGLRLGCLNHTLLTVDNIRKRQLPFAGWVVNHIDPKMEKQTENIETLERMIGCAPLGIIPHNGRLAAWNF